MSLKMLKEALSQYEDMIGSSASEIGTGAQKELDELERAAKAFAGSGDMEEDLFAQALMEQIAKEAE